MCRRSWWRACSQPGPKGPNRPTGERDTYYAYDEVGNRTSVIDPDANEAAYTYDAADRMWAAAAFGYTTYYEFDANGLMVQKLLGNACVTYHTYDPAGRLTSLENLKPDLSPLSTFAYTYDKDSNIIEIVRESNEVQYCSYDALHRLTDCDWRAADLTPIYSFEYDYDGVGNRTRLGREYGDTYYTYDAANELVTETDAEGATSYEFDANGNQSAVTDAAGTTYYEWTPDNMLSRIAFADGGHNYFQYDGNLARVRKDDSAGTAKYTWDGLNILLERDAAGAPLRSYARGHTPIYGIGSLVAHEDDSDVSFYQQDHIGSTTRTTDPSGVVAQQYEYSPFGVILDGPGDPNGQYLFSGKGWDGEADLYHFLMRQHDPKAGRFLSQDTIAASPEYSYCRANPANRTDPLGLDDRPLTPQERRGVQYVIDQVKKDSKYAAVGDELQRLLDQGIILAGEMEPSTYAQTSRFYGNAITINLNDFNIGSDEFASNPPLVAMLAGALVHEHGHRIVFRSGSRLGLIIDVIGRIPIPVGRDPYGQWRNLSELGPWTLHHDVHQRILKNLQKEFQRKIDAARRKAKDCYKQR